MQIKVVLDTDGAAIAGVDHEGLANNIQAELDKFASQVGAKPKRSSLSPPPGAQGDVPGIEWLIQVATDPAMARVYVSSAIFAINGIIQAVRASKSKASKPKAKKPTKAKEKEVDAQADDKLKVTVSAFGEKILLPMATSALRTLLKNLGDE